MKKRSAIAMMITLLFIVAITASLAISLGYVNRSNKKIQESHFLIQANSIVEDLLFFLKNAPELKEVKDAETLNLLLQTASVIPLEFHSLRVFIEIKSARAKFNINSLTASKELREKFTNYLQRYNVADSEYVVALLVDNIGGGVTESHQFYESDIFDEKLWLYRDKIASAKHLEEILNFYVKSRHDPTVYDIPWKELVRFGDTNETNGTALDLNYMTPAVWRMVMPSLDETFSEELGDNLAIYTKWEDLGFAPEEYKDLKDLYKAGFYSPILEVSIDIEDKNASAVIKFEYDLKNKKGKNFEFHI